MTAATTTQAGPRITWSSLREHKTVAQWPPATRRKTTFTIWSTTDAAGSTWQHRGTYGVYAWARDNAALIARRETSVVHVRVTENGADPRV